MLSSKIGSADPDERRTTLGALKPCVCVWAAARVHTRLPNEATLQNCGARARIFISVRSGSRKVRCCWPFQVRRARTFLVRLALGSWTLSIKEGCVASNQHARLQQILAVRPDPYARNTRCPVVAAFLILPVAFVAGLKKVWVETTCYLRYFIE